MLFSRLQLAVSGEFAKFSKGQWLETVKFQWRTFKDPNLKRQFKQLSVLGTAALPEDKYEKVRSKNILPTANNTISLIKSGRLIRFNFSFILPFFLLKALKSGNFVRFMLICLFCFFITVIAME